MPTVMVEERLDSATARPGFQRIRPFGPYHDDPLSLCFEKRLT